jgi:DinB family protein
MNTTPGSVPESPSQSRETFRTSVREFIRCIKTVPDELWLRKLVNWTPRDIVAHLIGWNVYVRQSCDLLRAGQAPAFLADREHDYRHVNAASVERYAAQDKRLVLDQLETTFQELDQYLARLDAAAWDADTGVRAGGRPVTIRNSIRAFARDYDNHRRRLEDWQTGIQRR